jgi:hypothetical protein
MKFMRNHWYDLGLIPITAAAICLIFGWSAMDILQKLAFFNFIVIFLHQFEEYRFPGGDLPLRIWRRSQVMMRPLTVIRSIRIMPWLSTWLPLIHFIFFLYYFLMFSGLDWPLSYLVWRS